MSGCSPEEKCSHFPVVLPSADFSSEGEDLGDEGEEESHVFSRSGHIKSLGLSMANSEASSNVSVHELESDSVPSLASSTNILESSGSKDGLEWPDGMLSTNSWDKFRDEFSDGLKEAEKAVAEEAVKGPMPSPPQNRDDLFIEMITAFHDSKLAQEEPEEVNSASDLQLATTDDDTSDANSEQVPKFQLSPTKPRKSLLSLSTLEAIQESDLDWSLENVDKAAESGLECNGEETESFTESNIGSPFSPRSRIAWEEVEKKVDSNEEPGVRKDEVSLMEKLQQLSRSQANGSVGFGESVMAGVAFTPATHLVQVAHPGREDKSTVFIDLRPGKNSSSDNGGRGVLTSSEPTVQSAANGEESSDSGSDEDDLYTWAARRRIMKGQQIKTTQASTAHPSTAPSASPASSTITTTPKHSSTEAHLSEDLTGSPQHTASATLLSSSSSSLSSISSSDHIMDGNPPPTSTSIGLSASFSSPHNLCTVHKVPPSSPSLTSTQSTTSTTTTTTSITNRENPNNIGNENHDYEQSPLTFSTSNKNKPSKGRNPAPSRSRNRNSSSFSDGDVANSSECATSPSCNSEDQQGKGSPTKTPSQATSAKGKKSKKKGRKAKKAQQKEPSSQSTSQHKEKSQRRRAYVLQRIRRESLNTSSDEEHSLSSNSSESLGTWDPVFTEHAQTDLRKEDRNAQRSVDEIKEELRKRIFSKKPPSYFETPGTEPIYHEDISFSSAVVDHILCGSSTGLLVVTLTCHNLLALPPALTDKVLVDAQGTLFCLITSWLVSQAAESEVRRTSTTRDEEDDMASSFHKIPFDVTGIQWTLLDGHSSLLVAVQRRKDVETNVLDNTNLFNDVVERYLTNTSVGEALHHLVHLEHVSDSITASALSPVFKLPLKSLINFQEDSSALSSPLSFYWYSSYHQSCLPSQESLLTEHRVTTTVFTLHKSSLRDPVLVFSVFLRALLSSLSIVGIRTAYGEQEDSIVSMPKSKRSASSDDSMCVAVALRGPDAIQRWMEIVGPQDSKLAKVTDPSSLTAKFGSDSIEALRTPFRSSAALAKWFGGRACLKTCSVLGMSDSHTKSERRKRQRVRFSETQSESEDNISSPMLLEPQFPPLVSNRPRLVVPAYVKCFLVVSPGIPLSTYGSILACCNKLGFDVFGCKRVRLNTKKASFLGIPGDCLARFTPSSTPPSPQVFLDSVSSHPLSSGVSVKQLLAPLPSSIFIIGRENGRLHSYALQNLISHSLTSLADCSSSVVLPFGARTSPSSLVHVSCFTEEKLRHFGSFSPVISQSNPVPEGLLEKDSLSSEFVEELCFVAIPGSENLPLCVNLLNANYRVDLLSELQFQIPVKTAAFDASEEHAEPELIGMKIVPQLPRFHSKRLCPLTSSEPYYSQAVQLLTDKPASLLVFRGIACSKKIQSFIKSLQKGLSHIPTLEDQLCFIPSRTSSEAVHFASLFFTGKELFSDPINWTLAPYYPQSWIHEADILQSFLGPRENLFSVVHLPLGAQMSLTLKILDRLTRSGFQVTGLSAVEVAATKEMPVEPRGAKLVACVERSNAVWAAQHVVRPFTRDRVIGSIAWAANFDVAVSEIKSYFPQGIWCPIVNSIMKDYAITQLSQDHFSGLVLSDDCRQWLKPESVLSYISPLNERTAILMLPALLDKRTGNGSTVSGCTGNFVQVLEVLHKASFQFCGLKMVHLSRDSAREIRIMCSVEVELESILGGPCLVAILERDNAASCFQLILKSTLNNLSHGDQLLSLFAHVLVPPDNKMAKQLLQFLDCL